MTLRNVEYETMDEREMRDLGPEMVRLGYLVHIAKLVDQHGNVSPLCAGDNPRAIDISKRESYVYAASNYHYVNCTSCMAAAETA